MLCLHKNGELSDDEIVDLMGFINTIITHITNGNHSEERLVNVMGGTVIETESEKLLRKGREEGIEKGIEKGQAKQIVKMSIRYNVTKENIIAELITELKVSDNQAKKYYDEYSNMEEGL